MSQSTPSWTRSRLRLLWAGLIAYLAIIGQLGLPAFHRLGDAAGPRDNGIWVAAMSPAWDHLTEIVYAFLGYFHGFLELGIVTLVPLLLDPLLPLTPSTYQIAGFLTLMVFAFMASRLGRFFGNPRYGLLLFASLTLLPLMAYLSRRTAYYPLLVPVVEMITVYGYVLFFAHRGRRPYNLLAALGLTLYLSMGGDWPTFLLFLFLFALLQRQLKPALFNIFNIIPLTLIYKFTDFQLYLLDNPERGGGPVIYRIFTKLSNTMGYMAHDPVYPWAKFGANVIVTLGLHGLLALFVIYHARRFLIADPPASLVPESSGSYAAPTGDRETRAAIWRHLHQAAAIWFLVAMPIYLATASHQGYSCTFILPLSLLTARFLVEMTAMRGLLIFMAVAMMGQWGVLYYKAHWWESHSNNQFPFEWRADARVNAAAAFLLDRRPDLLVEAKTALLPNTNVAGSIGNYTRGRYQRIIFDGELAATRGGVSSYTPRLVVDGFFEAFHERNALAFDWLALSDEDLAGMDGAEQIPEAAALFQALAADPRIDWFAHFRDASGRQVWLGEVAADAPGGAAPTSIDQAPLEEVAPWARRFTEAYDNFAHLSQDLDRVRRAY